MLTKQQIIDGLYRFINQRPGLEFGNYGDIKLYRSEVRSIGKDLQQARKLLREIELRDSINADKIIRAARSSYSGRLTISETDDGKLRINYCTGQYFPTEYRRAVCSLCSSLLWDYWYSSSHQIDEHDTVSQGQYIRITAKRELGRSIARRWFDA